MSDELKPYTIEQAIRISSQGLINQQAKCVRGGACCWKEDSKRCAIGFLIPDSLYMPSMLNYVDTAYLIEHYPKIERLWINLKYEFLLELQQIHDKFAVIVWPQKLEELEYKWIKPQEQNQ